MQCNDRYSCFRRKSAIKISRVQCFFVCTLFLTFSHFVFLTSVYHSKKNARFSAPNANSISNWLAQLNNSSNAKSPVIFRYEFGGGGVGDCIKGMVAVMQVALLIGRPFLVDFSRHPFGEALPFMHHIVATSAFREPSSSDSRVYNIGDWLTSPGRRLRRDSLFEALVMGALPPGVIVQTNLPMSRDLASCLGLREESVSQLAATLMAEVYSSVIDGATLGSLWPTSRAYRVALHLRTGDKFIDHATFNKNDERVSDEAAMLCALAKVPRIVAELAKEASVHAFACADTLIARKLLQLNLEANMTVIVPSRAPVHIGYASILERANAIQDAKDTLREHYTLASADALFMLSASGFSATACATAVNGRSPRCFLRHGDNWASFNVGGLFSL